MYALSRRTAVRAMQVTGDFGFLILFGAVCFVLGEVTAVLVIVRGVS